LGLTATGALVVLILENLALNLAYYVLAVPISPHPLDTIAYTSYKFVPINTSLFVWIVAGDLGYYITAVIVSISFGMFMVHISLSFHFSNQTLFNIGTIFAIYSRFKGRSCCKQS
jgi:hypothetical protein